MGRETAPQWEEDTAFPHRTPSRRLRRFGPHASGAGTQMYGNKKILLQVISLSTCDCRLDWSHSHFAV